MSTANARDPAFAGGAIGDGVHDDTAAIQAALDYVGAAGGGTVFLNRGTYKVTSTLLIQSNSVQLSGYGSGGNPGSVTTPIWAPATVLQWAGGATPVLKWNYVQGCYGADFAIDGGGTASHGLYLAGFQFGALRRVAVRNCVANTGIACYMSHGTSGANTCNTQWNSFDDLHLDGAQCLYLTGNRPTFTFDVTSCSFKNLTCVFTNNLTAAGVVLDMADGNSFIETYIFCKDLSAGGPALDIKDQSRNNFFFHLGTGGNSGGGITARTPAVAGYSNSIMFLSGGLDGSPIAPTIAAGANLNYWTYTNGVSDTFSMAATLLKAPHLSLREQTRRDIQNIKGETWERQLGTGGNQPTGGSCYFSAVGLMAGEVVTNLLCVIDGAGTTVTLSKLGLYDSSGNLLAKSADQGTSWQSVGAKTAALTAPYTVLTTGLYYIAVITAAAALPFLWRVVPNSANATLTFTGGSGNLWAFDATSGRGDFPASLTLSVGAGPCFWFGWN